VFLIKLTDSINTGRCTMNKKAIIILAEGFEEIEASTPVDVLRRADVDVTVAGLGATLIKGAHGLAYETDVELEDAGDDYDALVLPGGGPGARNLAASSKVSSLLEKMNSEGKIIAAICASPAVVLAPAGILNGKSATCYTGMEENFSENTSFKEEDVVVDGNVVTSRGPGTALSFSLKIAELLSGPDVSGKLKEDLLAGS
jgi:4-methyl-5(b-hydroxyethyl)-thiazole monophosphate biosynthesis